MRTDTTLLALLQYGDGLFPAGGFAHSFGLETLAQEGRVRDRDGLEAFVAAQLEGSAGPADGVAAAVAAQLAEQADVGGIAALDARLDAMKTVPEFRAASRQMGRQTLRVATAVTDDATVAALGEAVDTGLTPGHHAVVFGVVLGRAGAAPADVAAAYLYTTAALLVGAGLRLLPVGQLDGQRVLAAVRGRIAGLAAAAGVATADDMWSFTPGIEQAGIRHAALETRLFRS